MGFQTVTNIDQAPGIEGDACSVNPRHSALNATQGAYVAGSSGLTMGRFFWIAVDGRTVNNAGSGAPNGFVKRTLAAAITTYLAESGMAYLAGMPVGDLFSAGEFWAKNAGAGASAIGNKVFASNTTGQVQFGAAGATIAGYTETKWFAWSVGAAGELVKISSVSPV